MVQLIKTAYTVLRSGNIIFVCGGNNPEHMRQRFSTYCADNHPDLEIFFPEFAMHSYFSSGDVPPFDIADFELLVAQLSHAIVLFPEAPGSYAETGYFSALPELAKKTILAMDASYQGKDSFISLGPAVKLNKTSRFNAAIQTSYDSPEFIDIIDRINRIPLPQHRKDLTIDKFKDLTSYELYCLIYKCFWLLRIATIEDIVYILSSIFRSHLSKTKVKKLISVLVGAQYIIETGPYGHFYANVKKSDLLKIKTGRAREKSELMIDMANIYSECDPEFLHILEGIQNAA